MSRKDHTGLKYGQLTVISFARTDGEGKTARAVWLCRCTCGKERTFRSEHLVRKVKPAIHCGCQKQYVSTVRVAKPKNPYSKHRYLIDNPGLVAEQQRVVREGEKAPPPGDWRKSLIVASRRSYTPWPEVADLAGVTVEEAKALFASAA